MYLLFTSTLIQLGIFLLGTQGILASTAGSNWKSVSSDSTGQFLAAVTSSNYNKSYIQLSDDYGTTWYSPKGSQYLPWIDIDSDSTGKALVAVANCQSSNYIGCTPPQVSLDRGNTWYSAEEIGDVMCTSATVDVTGNYFSAICFYADASRGQMWGMFRSSAHRGQSWTLTQAPYKNFYNDYSSPLSAASNSYLLYVIEETVNVWGKSWTQSKISSYSWTDLASDNTATIVAATAGYKTSGTFIVSIDGGVNYQVVNDKLNCLSVSMDATGENIFVGVSDLTAGGIYHYSTSSKAFTKTSAPAYGFNSIAVDSTGQNILASAGAKGLFHSSDRGSIWKLL